MLVGVLLSSLGRLLKEVLRDKLTPSELEMLYASFDVVGDIAVIKVPEPLLPKKHIIAEALLSSLKNLRTVLLQTTPVEGEYRLRGLEVVAGEPKFETVHREHGCLYRVNLRTVYFTPRLSTERLRVAKLVKEGEVVVNMFAGVGPYSILIAKRVRDVKVYSIDNNPEAYRYMQENIKLNKVEHKVIPLLGDAAEVIKSRLQHIADRVIMPLPEKALAYLPVAYQALRGGKGMIHYYEHVFYEKGEDPLQKAVEHVRGNVEFKFDVEYAGVVRDVGPRLAQVVLDLRVG
jgi:tRNA (guanine37-N1)-methyltransferase